MASYAENVSIWWGHHVIAVSGNETAYVDNTINLIVIVMTSGQMHSLFYHDNVFYTRLLLVNSIANVLIQIG